MDKITCGRVISKVDDLMPNQYPEADKIAWLSSLDGKIFDELILTHEHPHWIHYEKHTTATDELLIQEPYGMDIYVPYLQAQIAKNNFESAKFNQFVQTYNSEYLNYVNWYNRKYMPLGARFGNRVHF